MLERAPALTFAPEVLLRAQDTRVVFFALDGCLTDGGLQWGIDGTLTLRLDTQDLFGLRLLERAGLSTVILSRHEAPFLDKALPASASLHLCCGCLDFVQAAQDILESLGLDWRQAAAMGADWPDLPLLERCAFACSCPQAHAQVRSVSHHTTHAPCGRGAAREFCDLLLMARGQYASLLQQEPPPQSPPKSPPKGVGT